MRRHRRPAVRCYASRAARNKIKRMLAMWLRSNEILDLDVVRHIEEFCWQHDWRGVADGDGDHTRLGWQDLLNKTEVAAARAATRLAYRAGGAAAIAMEAEADEEAAREFQRYSAKSYVCMELLLQALVNWAG